MSTTTYDFDAGFQTKVAALVLRDNSFMSITDSLVKPDYFEDQAEATLVDIGLSYYEKYKITPAPSTLVTLVKGRIASKAIREDMREPIRDKIKSLLKEDISDREFAADQCADFARHQAIALAIGDSIDLLEKRDFATIDQTIRDAMEVGRNTDFEEYDYFEEIENRTDYRKSVKMGLIAPAGVTTGSKEFDKYLKHKGWGRKELSLFMGAAKSGKTMGLATFAVNASLAGHNVLVVSLEVSRDIYAERIDANLADTKLKEMEDHIVEVRDRVTKKKVDAGKLRLHGFPTGTFRPSDLRRLINWYKGRGIVFDLVVVDYLDIMAPERFRNEAREESKDIFEQVRAIAQEENVAMLSATQTNRSGAAKSVAGATDVAEDYNKIRIADLVISINITEEERASGQARLFFAASRNQEGEFSVLISTDFSKAKFITAVHGRT